MKKHPYSRLPAHAYWRHAVAEVAPDEIDPVVDPPFRVGARDRIVTAGSCFAQHIGRHLAASGCNYLVTEKAHPFLTEGAAHALNYGVYSARYGNVYTSRQLLQLFERAYGRFTPKENYWVERAGVVVDPFRPQIQEGGFNSQRELELDRDGHFAAVREAFETLDAFIFTLGLTEAWRSREDKAVFPLCPGVAGGDYAPARHEFVNFGVDDVVADLTAFIAALAAVNPGARVILTVSPVPLVATAERRHVTVSTMASKSILRVACDILERHFSHVAYFPSYEIVAGGYGGLDYFGPDRRSVTPEGVAHVMRVFDRRFIKRNLVEEALRRTAQALTPVKPGAPDDAVAEAMRVMCDEEALELGATPTAATEEDEPGAEQLQGRSEG
ncbi:GSCFA domain-containing protein [Methylocystis parvus]|uniref:GSCFA domain-containing protein n=1 Tax=Methylocystis parvus TaxID=134 RepID=A0A6B8MAB9_9HYPH|nr:GSCFA domain-containing protein [Methylocystis parvus]QGM97600.1 GSCFA domain-containing protein [Methylocystis parvus]WBJ98467.1 GSCFA domain-containing protein [Methylocystis parvus OBBP]